MAGKKKFLKRDKAEAMAKKGLGSKASKEDTKHSPKEARKAMYGSKE